MKNFCFISLLAFTVFFCSCKNDDDSALAPIEQLPPQTTVGANTAGCLVNGEVLIPKGSNNGPAILRCQYAKRGDEYTFGLFILNNEVTPTKAVRILFSQNYPLPINSSIPLEIPNVENSSWGDYFVNGSFLTYSTSSEFKGELFITSINESTLQISGTFTFTAINDQGETVEITDGRFDMRYIP